MGVVCAQVYGRKNLRILYDAISTLADAVGSALAEVLHPCLLLLICANPLVLAWPVIF